MGTPDAETFTSISSNAHQFLTPSLSTPNYHIRLVSLSHLAYRCSVVLNNLMNEPE